jgi:hypothetical protein
MVNTSALHGIVHYFFLKWQDYWYMHQHFQKLVSVNLTSWNIIFLQVKPASLNEISFSKPKRRDNE